MLIEAKKVFKTIPQFPIQLAKFKFDPILNRFKLNIRWSTMANRRRLRLKREPQRATLLLLNKHRHLWKDNSRSAIKTCFKSIFVSFVPFWKLCCLKRYGHCNKWTMHHYYNCITRTYVLNFTFTWISTLDRRIYIDEIIVCRQNVCTLKVA